MDVTILGSAGWIPTRGQTSCVLVENGDDLIMLDAGTGVANLFAHQDVLARHDTLHLILSHYHLDHTIGLIYLPPFVRDKRLRIYGPGRLAYDHTNEELLEALLRQEFFSRCPSRLAEDAKCLDFPGSEFVVGGTRVTVQQQTHTAPSFRITLDDKLVYATDTTCPKEAWADASGKLLLHECWDAHGEENYRHTTLWQITHNIPRDAFDEVALLHRNPEWTDEDIARVKTQLAGTNVRLAHDGMNFVV